MQHVLQEVPPVASYIVPNNPWGLTQVQTPFYNTLHAPVGAFATFTLGSPGASGGLGLELAGPPRENLWIGCEDRDGKSLTVLPFHAQVKPVEEQFGLVDAPRQASGFPLRTFAEEDIVRELTAGRDTWIAEDLRFTIYSQAPRLPDPSLEDSQELRVGLVPAVLCEMVVDNRHGKECRRVFLGWQGSDPAGAMRCVDSNQVVGIAQGLGKGFFGASSTWVAGQGLHMEDVLEAVRNHDAGRLRHGVGTVCALVAEVPAGGVSVLHLVAAFHRDGVVTSGKECRYWYTRWWKNLVAVAEFALQHVEALVRAGKEADEWLNNPTLSRERRWMLAQAVHSYYASTEVLEDLNNPDEPLWIVNEGEYRMMNTMDLVVDHLFLELMRHPWTVRSVLDQYRRDYAVSDVLGLTFRHDMGVANAFTPPGFSAYEQSGRSGCFSYMCMEELVNWVLAAVTYGKVSNDIDWLLKRTQVFEEAMASLIARDHIDEDRALGVMQFDSDRCEGGSEITTYDSLDKSLGQARGSLYLAVKTWAAWLCLEWNYVLWGQEENAQRARSQAERAAASIMRTFNAKTGIFPALLDGSCDSAVIPVIESLVFPWLVWGEEKLGPAGPFHTMLDMFRRHVRTAMLARCRFQDGGWKLSESSDNSWLSKIYLCQAVSEQILKWKDPEGEQADRAHQSWLLQHDNAFWSWSDQMLAGKVCGSRHYPRGVTAVLWLMLK